MISILSSDNNALPLKHLSSKKTLLSWAKWPIRLKTLTHGFLVLMVIGASMTLFPNLCYAVPAGIPVISDMLGKIVPYGPFAFTAGGIYYSAINGRLVVNGDYRRVVPGVISILATTVGLAGLFGDAALTVLVP